MIDFELYVMDLAYDQHIKDPEKLREFSDELHQHLELAIEDYARDEGIDDYEPVY